MLYLQFEKACFENQYETLQVLSSFIFVSYLITRRKYVKKSKSELSQRMEEESSGDSYTTKRHKPSPKSRHVSHPIKKVKEEIHNAWYVNNDWNKAKELTIAARSAYPNDYEIMVNYLFFTTGGMADNDPNVLLQNEKEIIKVCDLILEGCDVENYRLEAINYKAKVLYAKGDKQGALELLNNFPSFYHASGQKIEQLYQKGTKEYYNQLTSNLYELATFVANKLGKYIIFDDKLSNEEKIDKVTKLVKLYNSIKGDKDYDILVKVIKDAVKEVVHRSKLIGFSNQEIRILEDINNEINR